MDKQDFALVGGGLLGRLLAWRLSQQGFRVALYEAGSRSGKGAAAYIAAAMLAPMAEAIDATAAVIRLGQASLALWPQWLAQWQQPVFFQQEGSLMLWHPQDKALAEHMRQHLRRSHGAPANGQETAWQEWDAAVLAAQEPQLAGRFRGGLFLPGEGQLDGRQVLAALAQELEKQQVQCFWNQNVNPDEVQDGAQWVIDCRGIGAKADWNSSTDAAKLRGIRGEVARVYAPEVALRRPVRLLHPRYPLYIAPKQAHIFIIGATQIESEDTSPISVRSTLELMSALFAVHPAFAEARVLETATALRPTLSHHDPEIRYDRAKRRIQINGLFRHGFMIAPAVVETAAAVAGTLNTGQTPASATDILITCLN